VSASPTHTHIIIIIVVIVIILMIIQITDTCGMRYLLCKLLTTVYAAPIRYRLVIKTEQNTV